jgi:hypothetical protein
VNSDTKTEDNSRIAHEIAALDCFLLRCSADQTTTLKHPDRGAVPVCDRHATRIPARLTGAEVAR